MSDAVRCEERANVPASRQSGRLAPVRPASRRMRQRAVAATPDRRLRTTVDPRTLHAQQRTVVIVISR